MVCDTSFSSMFKATIIWSLAGLCNVTCDSSKPTHFSSINPKQFHMMEVPGCRVTSKQRGRETVKKIWARCFQRKHEQLKQRLCFFVGRKKLKFSWLLMFPKTRWGNVEICWRYLKGSISLKWGSHCLFNANGKDMAWPVDPSAHLVWSSESSHQAVEVI